MFPLSPKKIWVAFWSSLLNKIYRREIFLYVCVWTICPFQWWTHLRSLLQGSLHVGHVLFSKTGRFLHITFSSKKLILYVSASMGIGILLGISIFLQINLYPCLLWRSFTSNMLKILVFSNFESLFILITHFTIYLISNNLFFFFSFTTKRCQLS